MTVTGPIDPDDLGMTLMHEHLLFEGMGTRTFAPVHDTPASEAAEWYQDMALENLYFPWTDRKLLKDNCILADVDAAIEEANEFRDWGGSTIVDVTNLGIRRDPFGLRRISNATHLNIVMGSSWYVPASYPEGMNERTLEELTDQIVMDITVGVGTARVRSGIIGEVGISGDPLTPNEIKVIRASARASRLTGAPISFHSGGAGREKLCVAGIVAEEGADLARTIFGHSDVVAADMDLVLELLETGVYIQFDLLGRLGVPLSWAGLNPEKPWQNYHDTSHTAIVADAVCRLIDSGHLDRILLSHDVAGKVQLKRYAGTGFSFIPETFLPHLRRIGVTDEQINHLVVENPKRVLTLAEPAT